MNTQIYATFGPSCGDKDTLRQMIEAGMTGMRLNLSHTTLADSEDYIRAYQEAASECNVAPQILIDMQGPELRVGKLDAPLLLQEQEKVILQSIREFQGDDAHEFSTNANYVISTERTIPIPHQVIDSAQAGDKILLDDGKILVEVMRVAEINTHGGHIEAKVLRGGLLQSHKSIKIEGRNVSMPVLTSHDIDNLKLAKSYGVTALMQPFVLSGEDLRHVRTLLKEHGAEDVQIFAKIENRIGVENLDNILPEADVIIIARGDLGNDMPLWELPVVQKQIENRCKEYHKPYIVVTQMLSSMENSPVPTRAEVSDIFHAVYHGAWGVMITGESAIGRYPVEAVKYLTNTANSTKTSDFTTR